MAGRQVSTNNTRAYIEVRSLGDVQGVDARERSVGSARVVMWVGRGANRRR